MAAESLYLPFRGLRVHVRTAVPEGDIAHRVLLIASPMMCAFNWRKLIPELTEKGCLCAMVDLPGFGASDCGPDAPQSARTRANIVWGVLDALDRETGAYQAMWHLLAHGSACPTALKMGNLYPESVRSQVLLSPILDQAGAPDPASAARWFDRNLANESGYRQYANRLFAHPADDFVLARMRAPLRRSGAKASFLQMLGTREPTEKQLGFSPTLAIWGGLDPLMTQNERARVLAYAPEAEIHVIKSAGHYPMETHSRALRDYLRGWLNYVG